MFSAIALLCSHTTGFCFNVVYPEVFNSNIECEIVLQESREKAARDPTILAVHKCINWGSGT